jgi:hypothetical protein
MWNDGCSISLLIGKTIASITQEKDRILFVCTDGDSFEAYHMQDCCESVDIHDVKGNLQSLVGKTIKDVNENISSDWPSDVENTCSKWDSFTWTKHTFLTDTDIVTVRWLGISNGYYSESVHFTRVHKQLKLGESQL